MRPTTRINLSLALGALTTVAVAWSCALLPPTAPPFYTTLNINDHGARPSRELNIQEYGRTGRRLIQLRIQYAIGPSSEDWRLAPVLQPDIEDAMASFPEARGESSESIRALYDATGGPPNGWPHWPYWLPEIPNSPAGLATFSARAAGWPLLAMRSTGVSADPDVPAKWRWTWRILTADHYEQSADPQIGAVPLALIPLAFAADTLLFATTWWLFLAGPGDIRRWQRRRHALCEHCAYSLAGLPGDAPCPECGRLPAQPLRRRLWLVGHRKQPADHLHQAPP